MRILFVNTGPWGTGSFTSIKGLTKELLKLGHEVKIFFPDANYESTDKNEYYSNQDLYHIWKFPIKTEIANLPTFPLMITDPHPRNPNAITFKELTDQQLHVYQDELRKQLSKVITSFKPDIIECHHIWYASWILAQMGMDFIVTAHHSDQLGFRYDNRIQSKAIASAEKAKKIIAISELVKHEVMRLYHVDQDKIIITANGYDRDIFRVISVDRKELLKKLAIDLPENAKIVNFAGKISRTKGFDTLLQANKLIDPKLNIHFIVMGSGDIQQICSKLDKDSYSLDNMHFVGHQTPEIVADIHNISLLSVMPSRSEGFGIASLEAMGCGLPMIFSRCGGPEKFSVGKDIEVGSAEQLAQGIMDILKMSADEYRKLRNQAIKAAEKFSMSAITQQHLEIYDSIL